MGIIFSVLSGKNRRGMVRPILPPNSFISKNEVLSSAAFLEAPIDPIADMSNVSAPLNTFLILSPVLKANPTVCILL